MAFTSQHRLTHLQRPKHGHSALRFASYSSSAILFDVPHCWRVVSGMGAPYIRPFVLLSQRVQIPPLLRERLAILPPVSFTVSTIVLDSVVPPGIVTTREELVEVPGIVITVDELVLVIEPGISIVRVVAGNSITRDVLVIVESPGPSMMMEEELVYDAPSLMTSMLLFTTSSTMVFLNSAATLISNTALPDVSPALSNASTRNSTYAFLSFLALAMIARAAGGTCGPKI